MKNERVIVVGGPRRGKSTLAHDLERNSPIGMSIRCGDPLSKVKDPLPGVQYLPEGLPFAGDDGAAQWIADNWFTLPGPWVCEGHVMARALRRWLVRPGYATNPPPCDRIIVLDMPAWVEASKGQEAMHKSVMTVWQGIAHAQPFHGIVEYRSGQIGQRPVRIIDGQKPRRR